MVKAEFIAVVLTQVIIISSFITIFFFTYAKKQEEKSLKLQLDFLIDTLLGDSILLPQGAKTAIIDMLHKVNTENEDADSRVKEKNNAIYNNAIKYVGIAAALGTIVVGLLWYYSNKNNSGFFEKFNILHLFRYSTVILLTVAVVEYIFLTYFGSNYLTIKPEIIQAEIMKKILYYILL
jgi:hypothetical protein